jgi:hypothetical protein
MIDACEAIYCRRWTELLVLLRKIQSAIAVGSMVVRRWRRIVVPTIASLGGLRATTCILCSSVSNCPVDCSMAETQHSVYNREVNPLSDVVNEVASVIDNPRTIDAWRQRRMH